MRNKRIIASVALIVILALVASGCAPTPKAQTVAEFYAANTATMIVPRSAGGGIDYAGRLFASYWSEVVEGGTMVVKNKPGAGGLEGMNYVYNAEPDGLTLGHHVKTEIFTPYFVEAPGVKHGIDFTFLGSFGESRYGLAISAALPYDNIQELQQAEGLKLASMTPDDAIAHFNALAIEFLGLKDARIVSGYGGTSEIELAIQRGEVDGFAITGDVMQAMEKKGVVKASLVSLESERDPYYPDAPSITELIEITPEVESLFGVTSIFASGRTYLTTPGVPEDRVRLLRDAFTQIVNNKGFLRQAKLRWTVWTEPVSGEEDAERAKKLVDVSQEDIAKFKQLIAKYAR